MSERSNVSRKFRILWEFKMDAVSNLDLSGSARQVFVDLWWRAKAESMTARASVRAIARTSGLSPNSVTKGLRELEESGLTKRRFKSGQPGRASVFAIRTNIHAFIHKPLGENENS